MPLLLAGGGDWGTDLASVIKTRDCAKLCAWGAHGTTQDFLNKPVVDVDEDSGIVFLQREGVVLSDSPARRWLASSDATTCCLVFAVSTGPSRQGRRTVVAAHVDDPALAKPFMAEVAKSGAPSFDLYMVGSFGASSTSVDIVMAVLACAQSSASSHCLRLCCTLQGNTRRGGGAPAVTCAALDLTTYELHPARVVFDTGEPFLPRHARLHMRGSGGHLHWAFDQSRDAYVPPPVTGGWAIAPFECYALLGMPDAKLLALTSTSPECEDASFVPRVRLVLRHIIAEAEAQHAEGAGAAGGGRTAGASGAGSGSGSGSSNGGMLARTLSWVARRG